MPLTIKPKFNPANQSSIKEMNIFKGENTKKVTDMPDTVGSTATERESYHILKEKKVTITVFDCISNISPKLRFEENLGKFNWQLEEGTDTIATYVCHKATLKFRGRNYIAWFTPDVPVSDGPWKFSGLPGLNLKVKDAKQAKPVAGISVTVKAKGATTMLGFALTDEKGFYELKFNTRADSICISVSGSSIMKQSDRTAKNSALFKNQQ